MSGNLIQLLVANEQTIRMARRRCRLFPFTITKEPGHHVPPVASGAQRVHDAATERTGALAQTLTTHGLVVRRESIEEDGGAIRGRESSQALLRDLACMLSTRARAYVGDLCVTHSAM